MRRIITILLAVAALPLAAQEYGQNRTIEIWNNSTAPHSNGLATPETETEPNIIGSVTEAKLYIFEADPAKATGQSIVICPGGGYAVVCIGYEGVDMAKWLASQGITCGVLKYRMPNGRKEVPLEDAVEALRIMRRNAAELDIDPAKVGIMGFSAGGHLAAYASNFAPEGEKPAFSILFYPVITGEDGLCHKGARNARDALHAARSAVSVGPRHRGADHQRHALLQCVEETRHKSLDAHLSRGVARLGHQRSLSLSRCLAGVAARLAERFVDGGFRTASRITSRRFYFRKIFRFAINCCTFETK